MATFSATDLNSKPRLMGEWGDVGLPEGKITATQFTSGDIFRICKISAGTEVHAIVLANDDLDSNGSPTAAFKLGYVPVSANEGALVANDAYFKSSGDITLQAANEGKVYSRFDAIKFEQDVYLVLTATANAATFAAGSFWAKVLGKIVGTK